MGSPYFGVMQNGKWGWVDQSLNFVIQPLYDYGFATCYNGIVTLERGGKKGGLYIDTKLEAFSFKYTMLSLIQGDTYVAKKEGTLAALIRPDDKEITDYKFLGFMEDEGPRHIIYVRKDFLGREVRGVIDPQTGRDLS